MMERRKTRLGDYRPAIRGPLVLTCALVALLAVAVYALPAVAQEPLGQEQAEQLFREANGLYAQGDYEQAATLYERIVDGGYEDADVYYNLGNARYKLGDLGHAVLSYERALRLDPTSEDVRTNLEFVRGRLADRQGSAGADLPPALERLGQYASAGTLAVLTSALYFALVALLIVGIMRRVFPPWLTRGVVVVGVLLVLSGAGLGVRLYRNAAEHGAIVVASDVAARTGPGEDFVLEFRLHEGTKVRMMETRGDWARVSVGGTDLEGWLPAGAVERI